MTKDELISHITDSFSVGDVLDNPGGGVSTLASVGPDKLSYIRGKSRMYLTYDIVFKVIDKYQRGILTTNNLRQLEPSIFDQKHGGHNCNCTFLLSVLTKLQFTEGGIQGMGQSGSPFFVRMKTGV
jgi:hypothetical protein